MIRVSLTIGKAIEKLANDRTLYTDMIFNAYGSAVDEAFRTQGFRTWKPLKEKTKRRRRLGQGYYSRPSNSSTWAYPANTWSAKMRDTVAGRTASFGFVRVGGGVQDIKIRASTSYMGWALLHRPLEGPVIDRIARLMEDKIHRGIIRNVEITIRGS